jgi:hypothetical protein
VQLAAIPGKRLLPGTMITDDSQLELNLEHRQRTLVVKHRILVTDSSKHGVVSSLVQLPLLKRQLDVSYLVPLDWQMQYVLCPAEA